MLNKENKLTSSVEAIAHSMFKALAHTFPVACATDEFSYFAQVRLPEPELSTWDCFTSGTVTKFVRRLSVWEDELTLLTSHQVALEINKHLF